MGEKKQTNNQTKRTRFHQTLSFFVLNVISYFTIFFFLNFWPLIGPNDV